MSSDEDHAAVKPPAPDSIDLVTQARSLRRKVIFWRRTAWLLLGGLGIFGIILWQRGEQHRRDCNIALEHYYKAAMEARLHQQPLELLEAEWRAMKSPPDVLSPLHYNIIARNWLTQPEEGQKLPLAICRESHVLGFSHGRHVLYHGGQIEWRSESRVGPIVQGAEFDDR